MTVRCPGQDMSRWTPADIYEIQCPHCRTEIEFFKDEPFLPCPGCHREVRNAKIDLGCAEWCEAAPECLGPVPDDPDEAVSQDERPSARGPVGPTAGGSHGVASRMGGPSRKRR